MISAMLAAILALSSQSNTVTAGCNIVAGDDWAFLSQAPPGWTVVCGKDAMHETAITLWPADQSSSNAQALIYVTVSDGKKENFDSAVKDDIARIISNDPGVVVSAMSKISPTRRLIHFGNSGGGRDELVEYVKGTTAYYTVVLTSVSPIATKKYEKSYKAFLNSFSPATVKHGG